MRWIHSSTQEGMFLLFWHLEILVSQWETKKLHSDPTVDLLSLRDPTQCLKPSETAIHPSSLQGRGGQSSHWQTNYWCSDSFQTKEGKLQCGLYWGELLCLAGLFFFYHRVKWSFAVLFVQSNQVEMEWRSVKEKEARIGYTSKAGPAVLWAY